MFWGLLQFSYSRWCESFIIITKELYFSKPYSNYYPCIPDIADFEGCKFAYIFLFNLIL